MDWYHLFAEIEKAGLSVWVRESPSILAFPAIIIIHSVGMSLVVGVAVSMDLRIFGFAPRVPLSALIALVPILRVGFWLNATSGVLLMLGFATKHLTNPVFYLKLAFIAAALLDTRLILHGIIRSPVEEERVSAKGKLLAAASIVLWTGSIVAGKLLYYTFTRRDPSGNLY